MYYSREQTQKAEESTEKGIFLVVLKISVGKREFDHDRFTLITETRRSTLRTRLHVANTIDSLKKSSLACSLPCLSFKVHMTIPQIPKICQHKICTIKRLVNKQTYKIDDDQNKPTNS